MVVIIIFSMWKMRMWECDLLLVFFCFCCCLCFGIEFHIILNIYTKYYLASSTRLHHISLRARCIRVCVCIFYIEDDRSVLGLILIRLCFLFALQFFRTSVVFLFSLLLPALWTTSSSSLATGCYGYDCKCSWFECRAHNRFDPP